MSGLVGHAGLLLGGVWSPAQLSATPKIWADDFSDITNVSGFASQWNDRSGNGWHFSQPANGSRPQVLSGELNGRRALRFDGTDDWMANGALGVFRSTGAAWIFSVHKKRVADASGTHRVLLYATNGGGSPGPSRVYSSVGRAAEPNRPAIVGRRLDADADGVLTSGTSKLSVWTMRFDVWDFASGQWSIYLDGTIDTTGSRGTSGATSNTDSAYITLAGARSLARVEAFGDVDLAALLVGAGSVPGGGDIERLFGWAAWRYGLQANLPPSHPYKTSPP